MLSHCYDRVYFIYIIFFITLCLLPNNQKLQRGVYFIHAVKVKLKTQLKAYAGDVLHI